MHKQSFWFFKRRKILVIKILEVVLSLKVFKKRETGALMSL